MWNQEEQQARRQGAAAMQEHLLLSIVSKSVGSVRENGPQPGLHFPGYVHSQARVSREPALKPTEFQSTASSGC